MFEPCHRVAGIMSKFGFSWFIAGGWAIDLFLDRETRVHDDIEIGIYRKNQMHLYRYFEKDKKHYMDNRSRTGKRERLEWRKEYLRLPVHELYIEHGGFEMEVLLNESDGSDWVYRRNEKIRLDEKKALRFTGDRIPYLSPEIVALYKTAEMRGKDIDDISNALTAMTESQKTWLFGSIGDKKTEEAVRRLNPAPAP